MTSYFAVPEPAPPVAEMRRGRVWLVLGLLAAIVLGHLAAFATQTEPWPFSRYTLYSSIYKKKPIHERLFYGILPNGNEFRLSHEHFYPMDRTRLHRAARLDLTPYVGRPDQGEAVKKWLDIYEMNRREGLHDGPKLAGLRLHDVEWHWRGLADNAGGPPDKRQLMVEYDPDGVGKDPTLGRRTKLKKRPAMFRTYWGRMTGEEFDRRLAAGELQ